MTPRAGAPWRRALAAVALAFATATNTADATAAGAGDPAPAFALPTAAGDVVSLARLAGKVVYVDFWASWCAPCRRSFPWMNALHQRYAPRGLTIVAINVDRNRADAEQFLARYPPEFAVVFDPAGATPGAYAVPGMPTSYLIDARGRIVQVEQGFLDDRADALEAQIRSLLAAR
jgi:cytochrome c biogenesis protein CcmG, thiol:disulfide interchange protein DsbE